MKSSITRAAWRIYDRVERISFQLFFASHSRSEQLRLIEFVRWLKQERVGSGSTWSYPIQQGPRSASRLSEFKQKVMATGANSRWSDGVTRAERWHGSDLSLALAQFFHDRRETEIEDLRWENERLRQVLALAEKPIEKPRAMGAAA